MPENKLYPPEGLRPPSSFTLQSLREAMEQLYTAGELPMKEKSRYAAEVLQTIAGRRNVELKLRKKTGRT